MEEKLPKQELLIKLLKMTTSNSDGEALAAIRMANNLLKTAGWDWEKLIHGKITIVEDPFSSISKPKGSHGDVDTHIQTPVKPAPQPTYTPPPAHTPHWTPPPIRPQAARPQAQPQARPQRPQPQPTQRKSPKSAADLIAAGYTALAGNTFPVKDELKNLGCVWESKTKMWFAPANVVTKAHFIIAQAPKAKQAWHTGVDIGDL